MPTNLKNNAYKTADVFVRNSNRKYKINSRCAHQKKFSFEFASNEFDFLSDIVLKSDCTNSEQIIKCKIAI